MGDGTVNIFALIINGDVDGEKAAEHAQNVTRAMEALLAEDPDIQISVANPGRPQPRSFDYFSTRETDPQRLVGGLNNLIDGIKSRMDNDDLFVAYITGHGIAVNGHEACIGLNTACHSLNDLAGSLQNLNYGKGLVVMDGCDTGNSFSRFTSDRTTVISLGSTDEAVDCQGFNPFFFAKDVTDVDGDGVVTFDERLQHAHVNGQITSLVQYYSPVTPFSFAGIEDKSPPFPIDQYPDYSKGRPYLTVNNAVDLRKALKRLKPTERALVMFSASWCPGCRAHLPVFAEQSKNYKGKYLMIYAHGIGGTPENLGTEQDWIDQFGVRDFPSVAFIDAFGDVTFVDDIKNPEASRLKAALHSVEDEVNYYLRIIEDASDDRVERIIKSLRRKARVALPILKKRLEDPSPRRALQAINIILEISDPEQAVKDLPIVPILERHLVSPEVDVQGRTLSLIAKLGVLGRPLRTRVASLLTHLDSAVVTMATQALVTMEEWELAEKALETARGLLGESNIRDIHHGLTIAQLLGARARGLIDLILPLTRHGDKELALYAIQALGIIKADRGDVRIGLGELLSHQDPEYIAQAAEALARIGREAALSQISRLERLLKRREGEVLIAAMRALATAGKCGSSARRRLDKMLGRNDDPELVFEALQTLGAMGPRASRSARKVKRLMNSQDSQIAVAAITAYAIIMGRKGGRSLLRLLDHPDPRIAFVAFEGLKESGYRSREAFPRLLDLHGRLPHELSENVKGYIITLVEDVDPEVSRDIELLDPNPEDDSVLPVVLRRLRYRGNRANPAMFAVVNLLAHPNHEVRYEAHAFLKASRGYLMPIIHELRDSLSDGRRDVRDKAAYLLEQTAWVLRATRNYDSGNPVARDHYRHFEEDLGRVWCDSEDKELTAALDKILGALDSDLVTTVGSKGVKCERSP